MKELERYGEMNVIYRYVNLTRLERNTPPYYYIGSKVECSMHKPYEDEDRYYLYDNKMDRCYFGSPSTQSYWDHWDTDLFTVQILEKVGNRADIREREAKWLVFHNAADSDEYYNMTNVTIHTRGGCSQPSAIVNIYGENYAEYASRMSNRSKRDNRAQALGFSNHGELALFIKDKYDEGNSFEYISKHILKQENRKFAGVTVRDYDLDKMKDEINLLKDNSEMIDTIRSHITLGASINKISEITNLEIPTVRYLIGEYWFGESGTRRTAKLFNKTQLEIELDIANRWVKGEGIKDIAKDYDAMSDTTIKRYLEDCLRRNLKDVILK